MNDLLYCESCGAEFELDEDVLLEDEDGNEYIECPECGELYEGFLRRFWKVYHGRQRAGKGKVLAKNVEKRMNKEMESDPEYRSFGRGKKLGLKLMNKLSGKVSGLHFRNIHRMFDPEMLGKVGHKMQKYQKERPRGLRAISSAAKFAWKTRKATGKKPVVKEDYIDEMLEAILEGYHPADVVDELMEGKFDPETAKWKVALGRATEKKKQAALLGLKAAESLPPSMPQAEKRSTFKTFYRMASGRKPPKSERPSAETFINRHGHEMGVSPKAKKNVYDVARRRTPSSFVGRHGGRLGYASKAKAHMAKAKYKKLMGR